MGSAKMRRLSSAPSNYLHHNQTMPFFSTSHFTNQVPRNPAIVSPSRLTLQPSLLLPSRIGI